MTGKGKTKTTFRMLYNKMFSSMAETQLMHVMEERWKEG